MLTQAETQAALALASARHSRAAIAPIRMSLPPGDTAAGYRVQQFNIDQALARGDRLVGWKIGLTSKAAQAHMGVDQPTRGALLGSMEIGAGGHLKRAGFIAPRLEGEIAFLIGADIREAPHRAADLAANIEAVSPAFEIVDSAIEHWDLGIVDVIADNGCAAAFAIGPWSPYHSSMDLPGAAMTLSRDGAVSVTGSGSAPLGDPLITLAWLAGDLAARQTPLKAGDWVLTGSLAPMIPVTAGRYRLAIDGLPHLEIVAF